MKARRLVCLLLTVLLLAGVASFAMAADTKKYHGIMTTAQLEEPKTLNPGWSMDGGGMSPCGNIFSRLVAMDVGCVPYADLAESWENNADFTVFTFYLRHGAKWHDGVEVTSADVKYSYDTMIEMGYPGKNYLKKVKEITCPDDYTVVITLTEPQVAFVPMLALAGNWYMYIFPRHVYEGEDWQTGAHAMTPVGSGPFKLLEWVKGDHITLEANPDYFLGPAYVDKLIIRFVPDVQVGIQAFKAGELDYLPYDFQPPYAELPDWEADTSIHMVKGVWIYGENLTFNCKRAPYDDKRVRTAIAMALDRDALNLQAFDNWWPTTMNVGIPAVPKWVNPDAKYPAYDLEGAKALLDAAGYPANAAGVRFETTIMDPPYEYDHLLTEAVIAQLAEVGIIAKWNKYDWDTWYTDISEGKYDLTIDYARWAPDAACYYDYFTTDGSRNFKGYSNPQVDALLSAGAQETDQVKRKQFYYDAQLLIVKDIPCVDLFGEIQIEFLKKNWHGNVYEPENFGKTMSWMGFYAYYSDTPMRGTRTSSPATPWAIGAAVIVVAGLAWFLVSRRRTGRAA